MNQDRPHQEGKQRRTLFALTLYSSLSLLLTWPLITHFSTHVPGDGIDDPSLAWNLWWIKARLVEQLNFDIFHADWTFFPIQINLAFYTLTPLNDLLSIPLQSAFSLVIASNLILLSSFVLGGLGAYLLARQELRQWQLTNPATSSLSVAALFAGIVYAFASSKLFYASLGQFNIASSQWVPFCLLFVLRIGRTEDRRRRLRSAMLAGLFFTFQAWAELTYATFLLIFIALCLLWQLLIEKGDRSFIDSARSLILALLPTGMIAAIGLSPFLWAMLPDMRTEGDFFTSGGGFADIFSADLMGYLLPTRLHPLLGGWVQTLPFPNDKGQQIFVGYSVMLLATVALIAALRKWQRARLVYFWWLNTLLFFLLTLGPHLRWLGKDLPIPGPFELVSRLPFFSGNRYPSRYSVMLMLCFAVLAALGLQTIAHATRNSQFATRNSQFAILFTLLFILEHLAIPLPINDFRVPSIYQRIAQIPGDFTLLELPTGWRNGAREIGRRDVIFMMQQWYQTTHGKRRLAGNTSRNPPYKFQYFSEAPLLDDLITLMNADQWFMTGEVDSQWQRMVDEARRDAPQVLDFLGVRYITVHVERSTPQLLRFVNEALPVKQVDSWQGNDWTGAPSTIQLYEVTRSAPFAEVDLRSEMGKLYQAEGWSALAGTGAATRPLATLMLNLPPTAGTLEVEIGDTSGTVQLWLNGKLLTTVDSATLAPGTMQTVRTEIPAGLADQLVDRLELRFADAVDFAASATNEWQLAGHTYSVPIAVHSAGLDVGSFGEIYVAGKQVAASLRGYNLVAISETGELLESRGFDTFGNCGAEPPDEGAAQAMAKWLTQWSAGTIIAGAAADEASCRLSQGAVDALHSIGVNGDLRGHFRWSHAFVGVVPTALQPAPAFESMTLLQTAQLRIGGGMDSPSVYARVGEIRYLPTASLSVSDSTP